MTRLPDGWEVGELSIAICDPVSHHTPTLTIKTVDDGGGVYLNLDVDASAECQSMTQHLTPTTMQQVLGLQHRLLCAAEEFASTIGPMRRAEEVDIARTLTEHARIIRALCAEVEALAERMNSKAPTPGESDPAAAITPTAEQEPLI